MGDGRIERREGLKVAMKQPKKGRLWFNDGSCVRLRPERRDHVWPYDFVPCRTITFRAVDNGPEFVAKAVRDWIGIVGAKTALIEPGAPWENGYCESFNGRFRDELLNGEICYSLREAQILIEQWRHHDNTKRPHSALGYRPPAPEVIIQINQKPPMN